MAADQLVLGLGVGAEAVDRHDRRHAELAHVARRGGRGWPGRVCSAFRSSLPSSSLATPPCILSARTVATITAAAGRQPGLAALDVEELLGAEIGAEAGLGDHVVAELERRARRHHRVAAMGDVGERAAMDEGGIALQRLHQVGRQRVLEQHRHGAGRLQVGRASPASGRGCSPTIIRPSRCSRSSRSVARQNTAITSEATVMSKPSSRGKPLATPPSEDDDLAQRAVVHVDRPPPGDAPLVEAERVAPVDVVVEQRREQVVGAADGVEVAGEVQVDLLHRHDLGVAAAGGAALHAEARARARARAGRSPPSCRSGSARRRGPPWSSSCPRRPASG